MNDQEYVAGALRTEAPITEELRKRFSDNKTISQFALAIRAAIRAGWRMDQFKKHFFYGRALPEGRQAALPAKYGGHLDAMEQSLGNAQLLRTLHASIGLFTEAGELLEAIHNHVFDGKPLDLVNVAEEFGDTFWYLAIGVDSLQKTFAELKAQNSAKLRARFPEKFTETDANVRDLAGERKVLEESVTADQILDRFTDAERAILAEHFAKVHLCEL